MDLSNLADKTPLEAKRGHLTDATLLGAQRGLLMRAIFGQFLHITLKDHSNETRQTVVEIIKAFDNEVNGRAEACGIILAFSPALWSKWSGREIPIHVDVLSNNTKFKMVAGDVLIYIKAPTAQLAKELADNVKPRFQKVAKGEVNQLAAGKRPDARIMSGRYVDSITNPNDPISMAEDILLEDVRGSCFCFTQNFKFDWDGISSHLPDAQDQMIGRNKDGAILSQHTPRGHIHHANVRDEFFNQRKLLRQALPYGAVKGSPGREEGLFFVAFCNEQIRFEKILGRLLGKDPDDLTTTADSLMSVVDGLGGNYWYVPAAEELGIASIRGVKDVYEDPHWDVRSQNGYMFYNAQDYLHKMATNDYIAKDAPSPRILSLISRTFNHWHDGWVHRQSFPRLPHLSEMKLTSEEEGEKTGAISVRKGLANRESLINFLSVPDKNLPNYRLSRDNGLLRIEPKELIVGVIPDFSFGRGKEVMPYLNEEERLRFWLNGSLSEFSAMGHVVPFFEKLVNKGLGALVSESQKMKGENSGAKADFYEAAIHSLRGVQGYMRNWSEIAKWASTRTNSSDDKENMLDISARMTRLAEEPPKSFQDAVQLVYSYHCCLHLVGELTAFGCLDRVFGPFLDKNDLVRAQEIIDCLWIKIGENAFVSRAFIEDYVTYGTTSVNGVCGNFPQGDGINQWCQQITVGGYKAAAGPPEPASNEVTMLCLKAARRLPMNAPTLSLRVHKGMDPKLVEEAAKCVLAGGAHPILFNDDKLCEGLKQSGGGVDEAWSRNYAADGCYEPMFCGASAFSFSNVEPMLALEQTINQGSRYRESGPIHLRGLKAAFRSPPPEEILTFEQLREVFFKQCEWLMVQCYNFLISNVGNLAAVCPSPLLSVLIDGCMETGRDLTDGGSRFHIIAPMVIGISNTIDSLYAINKLVYDPETAITTLPELVRCLSNDWGFDMKEPFQSRLSGAADAQEQALRYQQLRKSALELPKWGGSGVKELEVLGDDVINRLANMCNDVIRGPHGPHPALKSALEALKGKYGPNFEFSVCPGIGTFEGYVGDGIPCGASADGRRAGMPIASDLSPTPAAQDLPPLPAFRNIYQAMTSYKNEGAEIKFSNAAPVDMNITEDFPLEDLKTFIAAYAEGTVGGNLITLTCADLNTYRAASEDPEKYGLLRVRMGGWTEFYATMFPAHQDQHQRRTYFSEKDKKKLAEERRMQTSSTPL